jgi:hypothetical protein
MTHAQPPFKLLEGEELIGTYASEGILLSEIEAPDVDLYTVIDAHGSRFAVQMCLPTMIGPVEKLANMLGAPVRLQLVPLETPKSYQAH